MKTLKNIISLGALLGSVSLIIPSSSFAQTTEENPYNSKSYYTFERIEQVSPWLKSGNGAGLVYNYTPQNFSNATIFLKNENGDFKNYNQPKSSTGFGIDTKSYTQLNKVYFYGNFYYDRFVNKDQMWLGTLEQNSNLAPMVENIPGKVIKEQYMLDGGIGYKINNNFSAGFAVNYKDATAAKRTDGRNKNILSDFKVSPGISWASKYLKVGANFIYEFEVEKANYEYLGDASNKNLFYFEGLFMHTSENASIISTEKDRKYETNKYGVGGQIEFTLNDFSFYNEFNYLNGKTNNLEDDNFVKRVYTTDIREYNYKGIFSYKANKMDNYLSLRFTSKENALYAVMNSYEPIPGETNQYTWYENGKVMRYQDQTKKYGIEYSGVIKRSEQFANVDFTLGYLHTEVNKDHKHFPAIYHQDYKLDDFYASINKSFLFCKNSFLVAGVNGLYHKGDGIALEQTKPLIGTAIKMEKSLLAKDYLFNVTNHYAFGAQAKYSYIINPEKGFIAWFKLDYTYKQLCKDAELPEDLAGVAAFNKNNRNYLSITLGFNF